MSIPFNDKKLQLQYINCIVGVHDLLCNCYSPAFHAASILLKQLAPELKKEEKQQLQQCLTEETGTVEEETTGFDIGDLEKLFGEEENTTEDDNR